MLDVDAQRTRMREAAARGDSAEFYRAKALVEHYEAREAVHVADYPSFFFDREFHPPRGRHIPFDPRKHPRGRGGRWIDVLKALKSSPVHGVEGVNLPRHHRASRARGELRVHEPGGKVVARGKTPEGVRLDLFKREPGAAVQTPRVRVFDPSRVAAKQDPGTVWAGITTGLAVASAVPTLRKMRKERKAARLEREAQAAVPAKQDTGTRRRGGGNPFRGRVTLGNVLIPNEWAVAHGYADWTYRGPKGGSTYAGSNTVFNDIKWKPGAQERALVHYLSGRKPPENYPEGSKGYEQFAYKGRGKKADREALARRLAAATLARYRGDERNYKRLILEAVALALAETGT